MVLTNSNGPKNIRRPFKRFKPNPKEVRQPLPSQCGEQTRHFTILSPEQLRTSLEELRDRVVEDNIAKTICDNTYPASSLHYQRLITQFSRLTIHDDV